MRDLKLFKADDYYKIVAETVEQAKELYITELEGEEEEFYGDIIDPDKHFMLCPVAKLPTEYDKEPYKRFGDDKCVEVTMGIGMKYANREAPYVLAISSDLV